MPEAPRRRPERHTVLHTLVAPIAAHPPALFKALVERLRPATDPSTAFLADPGELLVVVQGTWWYRAEYRVRAADGGARLEHVVVNVAQRGGRAALLAGRRVTAGAPLAFHELVRALRAELAAPGA